MNDSMNDWKENLKDPEYLWRIPVVILILVGLWTGFGVGIKVFQRYKAQQELQTVQTALQEFQDGAAEDEAQASKTVSALAKGRKVADLESQYSRSLTGLLTKDIEPNKQASLEGSMKQTVSELASYFQDDSYQTAWFEGDIRISHPYWDFGTKYNINSDQTEFPVIWVCYDSAVGGSVLACTTAIFHVDTEKFSDAVTIQYDTRDLYGVSDNVLHSSLLAALQQAPVKGPQLHNPLEAELVDQLPSESSNSDITDTMPSVTNPGNTNTSNTGHEGLMEGLDPIGDEWNLDEEVTH